MRNYLILMRDGNELMPPARKINWNVLDVDNIAVEHHTKWAGLQIADVVTSAIFCGFEPNAYGNYEPRYAQILKPRLMLTRLGKALDCGLSPVPSWRKCAADELQTELIEELGLNWPEKRRGQAPGP